MKSPENIRFVTSNFTQLKGLRNAIIGLLLISTTLWADKRQGDLSLLIVLGTLSIILWLAIERHYRKKFGSVKPTRESRKHEILISIAFGIIGLGAFILDTTESVPISFLGIAFAAAILTDYLRLSLRWREKYFSFLPWFSAALLSVSLLPLVGLKNFWQQLGFRSPITGVMTLVGILVLISGLLSHFYLVKSLPDTLAES